MYIYIIYIYIICPAHIIFHSCLNSQEKQQSFHEHETTIPIRVLGMPRMIASVLCKALPGDVVGYSCG